MKSKNNKYYLTIGLEVHCQLNTKTKLFSDAENVSENIKPNTKISSTDLGAPGALPVVNERAVELAILAGFLFKMKINNILRFDRKNYFYPDLPKGYQITQYYEPVCKEGEFLGIIIDKLFIEEDTAKQIHLEKKTYLDYNRCGAALIEIVTKPFIVEDVTFVIKFIEKFIYELKSLGITKANLHQGDMRFDVNISLSNKKNKFSNYKVEIKNLNSLKNIKTAIEYEFQRQSSILKLGKKITSETRRFDEKTQITILMRKKFSIIDYKFFSEPSILPIYLDKIIDKQKLFYEKYLNEKRIINFYINDNVKTWIKNILDAQLIIDKNYFLKNNKNILDALNHIDIILFDKNPKKATNIATIKNEFEKYFLNNIFRYDEKENILKLWDSKLLIIDNNINVEKIILDLINKFPNIVGDYKTNPKRIEKFIIGSIFKETKGKANAKTILECIDKIFKK